MTYPIIFIDRNGTICCKMAYSNTMSKKDFDAYQMKVFNLITDILNDVRKANNTFHESKRNGKRMLQSYEHRISMGLNAKRS